MDLIPRSRTRRSRHGVLCTFSAPAGRRVRYGFLSIQTPGSESNGDSLAAATVCLGPKPAEPGPGGKVIRIRVPAEWDGKNGRALATNRQRPLSAYRAREPLVLDFVTLLLQPGHSHSLLESAAAGLVCSVLEAEKLLAQRRQKKAFLPG